MHMRWFARRLISAIFMVIIFLPCINMLWIAHVETITWKNLTLVVYRLQAVWRIVFSKALEILLGTWKDCSQVVWELCLGLHLLLICSRGISLFFTETRGLRGQVQKLNLNGCSNGDEVFIFISIFFGGAGNFKFSCAMLVWPSPLSSQPLFPFRILSPSSCSAFYAGDLLYLNLYTMQFQLWWQDLRFAVILNLKYHDHLWTVEADFCHFYCTLVDLWLGLDVSLEHDNLETRLYYLKISTIVHVIVS